VLHQSVTIPAFAAASYLQGGQWLPWPQVSRYHPHCKFELRQPKDLPQIVMADEFVVIRTGEETETQEGLQIHAQVLELHSERQPGMAPELRHLAGSRHRPTRQRTRIASGAGKHIYA
jgi:hypothetical protein